MATSSLHHELREEQDKLAEQKYKLAQLESQVATLQGELSSSGARTRQVQRLLPWHHLAPASLDRDDSHRRDWGVRVVLQIDSSTLVR